MLTFRLSSNLNFSLPVNASRMKRNIKFNMLAIWDRIRSASISSVSGLKLSLSLSLETLFFVASRYVANLHFMKWKLGAVTVHWKLGLITRKNKINEKRTWILTSSSHQAEQSTLKLQSSGNLRLLLKPLNRLVNFHFLNWNAGC